MRISDFYKGKEILITGGTGTLGKEITKMLLLAYEVKGIRIYSRDEEKHRDFQAHLQSLNLCEDVSFLVGDIRDRERLRRAAQGVDIIFHTAAMKQIPLCETNPIEAVRTNVDGSVNVIDCAIDNLVENVMLISTDKACHPANLYGATKACAEKLFLHANVYSPNETKFSVCRYGNVKGSRGSILKVFKDQLETENEITVTDPASTRFWIDVKDVAEFVITKMSSMGGNEIFIPVMDASYLNDFINQHFPGAVRKIIGLREGEKLHECLVAEEEMKHAYRSVDGLIICSSKFAEKRGYAKFKIDSKEFTSKFLSDFCEGGQNANA